MGGASGVGDETFMGMMLWSVLNFVFVPSSMGSVIEYCVLVLKGHGFEGSASRGLWCGLGFLFVFEISVWDAPSGHGV